jgi:DNA-binding NtrC family response regulator
MSRPIRILVVDDEESIRIATAAILEDQGYLVDTASNGREAIEKANANFYNAALIDYRLPDIEGTELLTSFRKTTPKMIKIMVTGYPSLQNAVTSVNRGADAFLMKPVSIETLLKMISDLLRRQEEEENYAEGKVAEFIETRFRKLEKRYPPGATKSADAPSS